MRKNFEESADNEGGETGSAPDPPQARAGLRWPAVLPGALIAAFLSTILLHLVLYNTLSNFVEPYPETPERLLTPLVVGGIFVWVGTRIVPAYKIETSVALFGLWVFVVGGFFFLALSGTRWLGVILFLRGGGLGVALAIAGAAAGLLISRKEQRDRAESSMV